MGDFSTSALSNRTMSSFPLSIGTGLACESLFQPMQAPYDPNRVIPQKIPLDEYKVIYVNLLTLYRNIIGALQKGGEGAVMAQDLSDTLKFEVELIRKLIQDESLGRTKAVFYASNYKDMGKAHPHATVREAKTDKQRMYNALMQASIEDFFKGQVRCETMEFFDRAVKPKHKERGLILTHMAYDLLSEPLFDGLDLLESHTGVRKTRGMWYTKLVNGKDLVRMPFCSVVLQVFGDSNTFAPQNQKLRQQFVKMAEQFNWNPMISMERVRFCIGSSKDHFTKEILSNMQKEKL